MRPATVAAAALLIAAAYTARRQLLDSAAPVANETGNADALAEFPEPEAYEPTDVGVFDTLTAAAMTAANTLIGTTAARMTTSATGLAAIRRHESCRLQRYRLGDGGWTIGWGRYYPDGGPLPPERIDQATADAWFLQDVAERGERWVRAYVTVDLTQPQFDALTSMAYNLSPKSFRTIADAVNAGQDPEAAAMRYIRAGTNLERGLRNRRLAELSTYRADPAYYG